MDNRLPAGMRNNNPGNIKFTRYSAQFPGAVGPSVNTDQGDPQVVFDNPVDGMRAAASLAFRKWKGGKTTISDLIAGQGGWTPGNVQAAKNIAQTMGVNPTKPVDLSDPRQMASFLRGLVTQEHGPASKAYGDDLLLKSSYMALGKQPEGGAADAVNDLAKGGVPVQYVEAAGYVPPPFSGDRAEFLPLQTLDQEPTQAPSPAGVHELHQGRQQQPSAAPQDALKAWGLSDTVEVPNADPAPATADPNAEIIKAWGLDGSSAKSAPAVGVAKAATTSPPPADDKIGANDVVRQTATGVPIIGGLLNKADAATNALLAPVLNPLFSKEEQLQGDTFEQRYHNALTQQNAADQNFEAHHPYVSTGAQLLGGVASMAPVAGTAAGGRLLGITGRTLGDRVAAGAASGALIGGTDAAVRSNGSPESIRSGAETGAMFGGGVPVAGKAIGAVARKGYNLLTSITPKGAAANNLMEAVGSSGLQPDQIIAELTRNPRLNAMDVDPNLQQMGMNLANQGGAARKVLNDAVESRMAGAKDAVSGAFDAAAGETPDTTKILGALRERQAAAALTSDKIGKMFDESLGTYSDPKAALEKYISDRSTQAQPLYEKALSKPVTWDDRLQQFIDEPIMQKALGHGVKIQRLESLADGSTFDPHDYAITNFNEAGDPIISAVPNMRTMNVMKKGLDALVSENTDPVTGRLTEMGRAINDVRKSFLSKLDASNPDYAAARKAWEGPTRVREAYLKGLNLFQNKTGAAGVETTPEAVAAWAKNATPDELKALKLGARASIEQQMQNSANGVDRATRMAANTANQKKLAAILGEGPAKKIIDSLSARYSDPVGDAFSKGVDILRNRTGSAGIEDRPEHWREWFNAASPNEREAAKQGARVAIDNQINSVRSAAAKGASIPDVGFNRDRLEILLGKAETDKLAQILKDEQRIAQTNNKLFAGSQTAPRQAVNKLTEVRPVNANISFHTPLAAGVGYEVGGLPGAAAGLAISGARRGAQYLGSIRDLARNRLMAEAIAGDAGQFKEAIEPGISRNRLAGTLDTNINRGLPLIVGAANVQANRLLGKGSGPTVINIPY